MIDFFFTLVVAKLDVLAAFELLKAAWGQISFIFDKYRKPAEVSLSYFTERYFVCRNLISKRSCLEFIISIVQLFSGDYDFESQ